MYRLCTHLENITNKEDGMSERKALGAPTNFKPVSVAEWSTTHILSAFIHGAYRQRELRKVTEFFGVSCSLNQLSVVHLDHPPVRRNIPAVVACDLSVERNISGNNQCKVSRLTSLILLHSVMDPIMEVAPQGLRTLVPSQGLGTLATSHVLGTLVPLQVIVTLAPSQLLGNLVPSQLQGSLVPFQVLGILAPSQLLGNLVPSQLQGSLVPFQVLGILDPSQLLGNLVPSQLQGSLVPFQKYSRSCCLISSSLEPNSGAEIRMRTDCIENMVQLNGGVTLRSNREITSQKGCKAQGTPPGPEGPYDNNNNRRLLTIRRPQNGVFREQQKTLTNWYPVS
uniref:(California timema) hypothetical protein n=1 Tax=Timema californicum TaxID=61474 RepID=A0A7R9IVR8_TIMCA|nr:unnamed protein product [Timema californicum]